MLQHLQHPQRLQQWTASTPDSKTRQRTQARGSKSDGVTGSHILQYLHSQPVETGSACWGRGSCSPALPQLTHLLQQHPAAWGSKHARQHMQDHISKEYDVTVSCEACSTQGSLVLRVWQCSSVRKMRPYPTRAAPPCQQMTPRHCGLTTTPSMAPTHTPVPPSLPPHPSATNTPLSTQHTHPTYLQHRHALMHRHQLSPHHPSVRVVP